MLTIICVFLMTAVMPSIFKHKGHLDDLQDFIEPLLPQH